MKTLKKSFVILVLSFGYIQSANAGDSKIVDATTSANAGATVEAVGKNIEKGNDTIAEGVKDTVFDAAREKGEAREAESMLQQLEGKVGSAGSAMQLLDVVQNIQKGAAKCTSYVEEGVNCCKNPKSCGGSEESAAGQADQAANQTSQQAQQAAGGGGGGGEGGGKGAAAAQCLAALPGLMAMTGKSKGTSKACGYIRDGDGDKKGCMDICEGFGELAADAENASIKFLDDPKQKNAAKAVQALAKNIKKEATSSMKKCSSDTQTGQQAANAQAGSGAQAIQGLMQCIQSLMAGDETKDEDELKEDEDKPDGPKFAVNCSSIAERAANPDQCIGYTGGGDGDGNLSKTSGSDLAIEDGGLSTDFGDDPLDGEGNEKTNGLPPPPGGQGAGAGLGGFPVAASLTGGAGSGGENRKTGRGKGKGKGKDLISGYKNVKGGAGGGGYGRAPASKEFKPFSFGKKKDKKDKKALAALSKLMKAGISPDQTGSIFVRASKRFVSSSAKEKLFDARRNRSMWMEKRK